MKHFTLFFLSITFLLTSCGTIKVSNSDAIVEYPDVEAQYPGGAKAMSKYLANNIKYPEIAMELGDQGRVFVEFVIEKDGSISNVRVLRGVSNEIDAESVRVVSNMKNWTPAIYKRKYVRARARIPINYILE
ncbi:energy transducer TonB [Brumimicrobium sp.]|uniref:energy transducer TonB n=1 Tax=Brumimicrobium sp. TaxID=2029867 RepID=UPI003A91AD6F